MFINLFIKTNCLFHLTCGSFFILTNPTQKNSYPLPSFSTLICSQNSLKTEMRRRLTKTVLDSHLRIIVIRSFLDVQPVTEPNIIHVFWVLSFSVIVMLIIMIFSCVNSSYWSANQNREFILYFQKEQPKVGKINSRLDQYTKSATKKQPAVDQSEAEI